MPSLFTTVHSEHREKGPVRSTVWIIYHGFILQQETKLWANCDRQKRRFYLDVTPLYAQTIAVLIHRVINLMEKQTRWWIICEISLCILRREFHEYPLKFHWGVILGVDQTSTTRTPAFWGYPPPPYDFPYYWPVHFESQVHTIDQFISDPKSKQGESRKIREICAKIEILELCYKLNMWHTL